MRSFVQAIYFLFPVISLVTFVFISCFVKLEEGVKPKSCFFAIINHLKRYLLCFICDSIKGESLFIMYVIVFECYVMYL